MGVSLYLFGAPRIEREGQSIHMDTRKATALIAYLATQGGFQSRDTLSVMLWADNDHSGARGALRRTLSTLNSALNGCGIVIEREAIAFDPTGIQCDLVAFNNALRECEGHGHSSQEVCNRCLRPLMQMVELYKGDFLQGFSLKDSAEFDLWQFHQTEHLRRLYGMTLEKLVRLHTETEDYRQAISTALRWLALDPLHEAAHRQLIQLYALSGERSLALRQYHECVRVLDQELGVAPLDETTRLYQQVFENAFKTRVNTDTSVWSPTPGTGSQQRQLQLPLVGREAELGQIEQAYQVAQERAVVVVEGEAGAGKTRLVEHFASRRRTEGSAVINIRCYESETGIAYAPVIRALREAIRNGDIDSLAPHWASELGRLLPEVHSLRPGLPTYSTDTTAAQSRLYEALCQVITLLLGGRGPGVLLFEDAQWADSATLDLLVYWLRRPASGAEVGVMTWRTEEVPRTHRLRLLLADYVRSGGSMTVITPQRLSHNAIQHLVSAAQLPPDTELLTRICDESEGLPLFVHEYLALLQANPALQKEAEWGMPMGIHELLHSHVTQVSEIARQILDTASVIGRSFDLDLVRDCSGRYEEEAVDGADELQRRGILRDIPGALPTYEFHHEKLRAVVYQELSMARKRLLHRRAAQVILNRVGQTDKLAATAALIATHFHAGGQDVSAAEHYVMAGLHARALYANREALSYFERALALGYPHPTELYRHTGDLYTMMGDYRAAIRSYETGTAHAAVEQSAVFEQMLGRVYHRLGDWDLAETYFQSALRSLKAEALVERASLLTDLSLTKIAMGDPAQASILAQSALDTAEQTDNAWVRAQVHNLTGLLLRKQGAFEQAYQHLHTSLRLAEQLEDIGMYVAALNNLALMHMESEAYIDAQEVFETALENCARLGDLHREAALHNNYADLLHLMREPDEAMKHLKTAVTLFAQIGQRDTEMRPEIWKLAEW